MLICGHLEGSGVGVLWKTLWKLNRGKLTPASASESESFSGSAGHRLSNRKYMSYEDALIAEIPPQTNLPAGSHPDICTGLQQLRYETVFCCKPPRNHAC